MNEHSGVTAYSVTEECCAVVHTLAGALCVPGKLHGPTIRLEQFQDSAGRCEVVPSETVLATPCVVPVQETLWIRSCDIAPDGVPLPDKALRHARTWPC